MKNLSELSKKSFTLHFHFLFSLFDELYAAVLGAASIRLIVSNGFMGALANGTQIEAVAAKAFERLHHCLSTLLREGVVDGIRALIVSMSLYLKAHVGVDACIVWIKTGNGCTRYYSWHGKYR